MSSAARAAVQLMGEIEGHGQPQRDRM
jgi:hypothetical protein